MWSKITETGYISREDAHLKIINTYTQAEHKHQYISSHRQDSHASSQTQNKSSAHPHTAHANKRNRMNTNIFNVFEQTLSVW